MNPQETARMIEQGDLRQAARLMRDLDDGRTEAVQVLKILHKKAGRAEVVGITGSPGVGKSTLTDLLINRIRKQGRTVGVVAVDPTSPFSGGAILGDRVRMQKHADDEGVFIRSLATRGSFGGLTASTRGVVTIMDAMGKDVILVETVGVGQDEVDIAGMADTTMVVTVPGLGDDVQAIKAGILEVGDIFVVNKMDRPGHEMALNQIRSMLAMESNRAATFGVEPTVVSTCAADGRGLDLLITAMADHRKALCANGSELLMKKRARGARMYLMDLVKRKALERLFGRLEEEHRLKAVLKDIADGRSDPYTECEKIIDAAFSE